MSNHCEDIRLMLVESAYGELEPMDEKILESHLLECEACARRRDAFVAVRAELGAWERVDPPTTRITFVGTDARAGAAGRRRRWQRGLAAAASFVLGFLLIAATFNVELSRDERGWSLRTSLLPRPVVAAPGDTPDPAGTSGPVDRIGDDGPRPSVQVSQPSGGGEFRVVPELESWLDQRLQERLQLARSDAGGTLELRAEQVQPVVEELLRERDRQVRALVRGLVQDMLASAQSRQQQELENALSGLYQTFDAQRTNDLLFLAGELGSLQEATGMELQQTNAAIEYLINLRAEESDPSGPATPERSLERQQ